jgi:ribosome biogenesis GTPase
LTLATNTQQDIDGVIIKGVGGAYFVATDEGTFTCAARGIFRNRQITPMVGDRVVIEITDRAEMEGTLHTVKPRINELPRPRVANVDLAVITMAAANPEFNGGLLDRFLLLAEYCRVPAAVCVNKCDLIPADNLEELCAPYVTAGYKVIRVSADEGLGLDELKEYMTGKTSVFAGPSGVGKSSLINRVTGQVKREVGSLSEKIKRGKHTTRHTELLPVEPAGFCVDTPGFTSLDLSKVSAGELAGLFVEFKPYLGRCRFSDCRHDSESDCAVKEAVGTAIHPLRYERYLQLLKDRRSSR